MTDPTRPEPTIRSYLETIHYWSSSCPSPVEDAVVAALALLDNAEHENYGDPYGWCRLVPDPTSAP